MSVNIDLMYGLPLQKPATWKNTLDRVIDIACGTGDLVEMAEARGAEVIGVDFARRAGVRKLLLYHHEPTYSDSQLEEIQATANKAAADASAAAAAAESARAAADRAAQAAAAAQSTADQALSAATEAQACCEANRESMERMFQKSMSK